MLYRFDEAEVLVDNPRILKGPTAQVWKARWKVMVDMLVICGIPDNAGRFMLQCSQWSRKRSYHYVIDEEGRIWNILPIEKGSLPVNLTPGLKYASTRSVSVAIAQPARTPPCPAQVESLYQLCDYILKLVPTIVYLHLGRELSPGRTDPWGLDGDILRTKYGMRSYHQERIEKTLRRRERAQQLREYTEALETMGRQYEQISA